MNTLLRLKVLSLLLIVSVTNSYCQNPETETFPRLSVPEGQAYAGAYIDFGEHEDSVTPQAIKNFDKMAGKKQAVIGFSSDWGLQNFPWQQLKVIDDYGAVPVIYWSPFDRPLGAPRAQNRFHLKKILAGEWDAYIDMWAGEAKKFGKSMLVAWGLEMNGQWFPWSGSFYGADNPVPGKGSARYQGPEIFKQTYRYVVDRARQAGADNILWIFHANNTSDPNESWNRMEHYYPGDDYVDWLGMSNYGQQYPDQKWADFEIVVPIPYKEISALHPDKPIILAEWGVGEFPPGNKAAWLDEAFARMPVECPRIKAIVYWHELWKNGDGKWSNIRINSSPQAQKAYQRGVANPYWLDRPMLKSEAP